MSLYNNKIIILAQQGNIVYLVLLPGLVTLYVRSVSSRYGTEQPLLLSWCVTSIPLQPAESDRRGYSPPPHFHISRLTSSMLDNEEFMVDTSPRELTQNPLRKIWMPYKNGHIAQRRGKMQLAGKCCKGCDWEVMRGICSQSFFSSYFICFIWSVFSWVQTVTDMQFCGFYARLFYVLRTDKVLDYVAFLCLAVLHQPVCFIFFWRCIWITLGGIIASPLNWIWPYDMHMSQMHQSNLTHSSLSVDLWLWMCSCALSLQLGWFLLSQALLFSSSPALNIFLNLTFNHVVLHAHYWLQEPLYEATLNPLSHMDCEVQSGSVRWTLACRTI